MRMAGGNGSAASSLASGSVMDRPCAAAICRDEAVFTTCYFAPMGRGHSIGRRVLQGGIALGALGAAGLPAASAYAAPAAAARLPARGNVVIRNAYVMTMEP